MIQTKKNKLFEKKKKKKKVFISLQSRIIKCSINSSPSDPDLEYEIYNISAGEWAVIGIGTVFHFVNLCGLAYVLYNRKYPPLKIEQLEVVTLNLISIFLLLIHKIYN